MNSTRKKAFERARKKAESILRDPAKTKEIVNSALDKAASAKKGTQFDEIAAKFHALVRLVRSYIAREYKVVPWQTIILGVTALVYFVTPFDAIFDFIPLLGFADDVAVLTAVFSSINHELDKFIEWEKSRVADAPPESVPTVEADYVEVKEG